jgi:hypothetical protein
MTRCAVVSYEVDATDGEKIKALKDGVEECAFELYDRDLSIGQIELLFEEVISQLSFWDDSMNFPL